ncbi:MAG: DNA primase, partial [Shewanella sp.]
MKIDIEKVKSSVDIVDVISNYVDMKKAGKNYHGCCPFHDEKTPSFTVAQDKQFYHCFGCGAHGDVIGFIMDYTNVDFREAVKSIDSNAFTDLR